MKIHKVTHDDTLVGPDGQRQGWCGPAAISAITGRTAECAAAWINHSARRRQPLHYKVRGTWAWEVRMALECLGYTMRNQVVPKGELRRIGRGTSRRPTFAQWMRSKARDRSKMYLVAAGEHWMVVKGTKVVCSAQPDGVTTGKSRKRRCLVTEVYLVEKTETGTAQKIRAKRLDPLPRLVETTRRAAGKGRQRPYPKKHEVPTITERGPAELERLLRF